MRRITIVIATLLLVSSVAIAQMGPRPGMAASGPLAGPPQGDPLGEFLGLSDSQKAGVQTLRETLRSTVEPLVEQQRAIREQIAPALESTAPDAAAIGQLVINEYRIGQQIRAAHDAYETAFKALLTPEQLEKYALFRLVQRIGGGQQGGGQQGPPRP